jgi:hypothetical protein
MTREEKKIKGLKKWRGQKIENFVCKYLVYINYCPELNLASKV